MDGDAIDSCCLWLLRVGIDHSGKLDPTRLWDFGVRGAILADLWLSDRIVDVGDSLQLDTDPTGIPHLDTAIGQLIDSGMTPYEWMGRGWLRATDVADDLVRDGEWTVRRSLSASRWRIYHSQAVRQHVPMRQRLAHVYEQHIPPPSPAEATVALLGHALNVVRPDKWGKPKFDGLWVNACGRAAPVVEATVDAILGLIATSGRNANPTW